MLEGLVPVVEKRAKLYTRVGSYMDFADAIAFGAKENVDMVIITSPFAAAMGVKALAGKNVPIILTEVQSMPQSEDVSHNYNYAAGDVLQKAGVKFSFSTGGYDSARNLPYQAAQSVAWGLSKDDAIKALTINAAEILGVGASVGSLEEGKIANLFIVDGDPLELTTQRQERDHQRARRQPREQALAALAAFHGQKVGGRDHEKDIHRCPSLSFSPSPPRARRGRRQRRTRFAARRSCRWSGAEIASGNIVLRNGLIEAVGASAAIPNDAIVIDGAGLTVYPGLIDMGNAAAIDAPAAAAGADAAGGRGGPAAAPGQSRESLERAKRLSILRPDYQAAENVRIEGPELTRLAAAGITSVLATPGGNIFRGQSALVNVVAPPDDPQIGSVADLRRTMTVVEAPVALHVNFNPGGGPYPASLLGAISFMRQSFMDAVVAAAGAQVLRKEPGNAPSGVGSGAQRAAAGDRSPRSPSRSRRTRCARSRACCGWPRSSTSGRSSRAPVRRTRWRRS